MEGKRQHASPTRDRHLYVQARANGREVWYGRWYLGGRRVNRRLGPKLHRDNYRAMSLTDSPRFQRSQSSLRSAAEYHLCLLPSHLLGLGKGRGVLR